MSFKSFNCFFPSTSRERERENSFSSSLKRNSSYTMCVFKLKNVLISLILSVLLLCGVSFPFSGVSAQNYDIVVEAEINEQTVKIIEINFNEDIVHFYKFSSDGNPIYENGEQVTFSPGDENFEQYIGNLVTALIVNALTIQSSQEFSFQIYYGNLSDWEMVLQLCYDDDSDYRLYEHHELDDPFDAGSAIGDFSILFVGEETYTGYKYSIDPLDEKWNRANTQGNNSGSIYAEMKKEDKDGTKGIVRFKITGKTSSGKHVKIEDKGDGKGPKVYTGEDRNGNGKIDDDEWTEVTDQEEVEDIIDEVSDDLENGIGDYEGEAYDSAGNPINAIKITRNGSGGWDLDGKNRVSHQWMVDHYFLPAGDDPNPTGAWFVGGNMPGYPNYSFVKYARFDENGNPDPNGEQKPYAFSPGGLVPIPYDPPEQGFFLFSLPNEYCWP